MRRTCAPRALVPAETTYESVRHSSTDVGSEQTGVAKLRGVMRKRGERDMIVLGGWLFADLLLGLAMVFLTANTVGRADPPPTPTATPNLLATATAQLVAANQTATAAAAQVVGLSTEVAEEQVAAQQTADAQATAEAV